MLRSAVDHNAAQTRVRTRPAWTLILIMFLVGSIYRLYWAWRTSEDLRGFLRFRPYITSPDFHATRPSIVPTTPPILLALSFVGWILVGFVALPWGVLGYQPTDPDLTGRIIAGVIGVGLLVPGAITIVQLRGHIRHARRMAGLAPDTRWTRGWFWVLLSSEVFAVPLWMFALQGSLNDLWSHYPALLDEDLHGELAPPAARDAAVAQRPALHQRRLERIADELGDPDVAPWVTIAVSALCAGLWTWQVTQHGFFPDAYDIEQVGGLREDIDGFWWRFWLANVLHGSVEHFVGNIAIFGLIGTLLERAVGHVRMLALVVLGAAGCSVGALMVHPDEVSVGASGIVFAAFGMAAAVDPLARRAVGRAGWLLSLLGVGFSTFVAGISSGGHLGGLLAGGGLGLVVLIVWRVPRVPVERLLEHLSVVRELDAPLAPERELSVQERLDHLNRQHAAGELSQASLDRLRAALLMRG